MNEPRSTRRAILQRLASLPPPRAGDVRHFQRWALERERLLQALRPLLGGPGGRTMPLDPDERVWMACAHGHLVKVTQRLERHRHKLRAAVAGERGGAERPPSPEKTP